jgi:hypothetical protein
MNPFRRRINPDDLIAYHLHELSPRRERSVRRALQADPSLAAESEAIARTLALFPAQDASASLDSSTLDSYWLKLRPSLTPYPAKPTQPIGYRRPLFAGIGIAALVAATFFVALDHLPVTTPARPASAGLALSTVPNNSPSNEPSLRNPPLTHFAPNVLRRSALSLLAAPLLMVPSVPAQTTQSSPPEVASSSQPSPIPNEPGASTSQPEPAQPTPAQSESGKTAPTPTKAKPHLATSFSLGAASQLTATRLTGDVAYPAQSLDPSAAVLGTFRQSFRPWLGYSINMGYSRTTQHNLTSTVSYPQGSATLLRFDIPANMYELSASYVAQKRVTPKLTGFVDIGAGMVSFLPIHRGADAANYVPNNNRALVPPVTFRPAGVGGFGVDYHLTRHLGLRAEYRALVYKYADYGINLPKAVTVSSEPTVSLTWNLGKESVKK